ncbi:dihydrodipicolinate synthase family protein, partial [Microbispora rosea]
SPARHAWTSSANSPVRRWAGDVEHARALGHRLSLMSAAMFAEPNPTVLKGVLHARGCIPTAAVRLPLVPASQASIEAALRML